MHGLPAALKFITALASSLCCFTIICCLRHHTCPHPPQAHQIATHTLHACPVPSSPLNSEVQHPDRTQTEVPCRTTLCTAYLACMRPAAEEGTAAVVSRLKAAAPRFCRRVSRCYPGAHTVEAPCVCRHSRSNPLRLLVALLATTAHPAPGQTAQCTMAAERLLRRGRYPSQVHHHLRRRHRQYHLPHRRVPAPLHRRPGMRPGPSKHRHHLRLAWC